MERALRSHDADQARIDGIRKTYRWRCVRAQVLRQEPLCRPCVAAGRTELAREVDHIEPLTARPDLAFVPENLQPICKSCHAKKGAVERGLTPRRKA